MIVVSNLVIVVSNLLVYGVLKQHAVYIHNVQVDYLLDLYDEGPLELHFQLLHFALHVLQTPESVHLLFKLLGTLLVFPEHLQDRDKVVVRNGASTLPDPLMK